MLQVFPREGKCRSNTHFGIMQFRTSWDQETTQTLIGHNLTNRLTVKSEAIFLTNLKTLNSNIFRDFLLKFCRQY